MKLLDTDCFSEVAGGNDAYIARFESIEKPLRGIPIIVAEEAFRGWLAKIRELQSKGRMERLVWAYGKLQQAIEFMRDVNIIPYTPAAHEHYLRLKSQKLRIVTRDLRIASIALAHDATLITRNRRDFDIVPSLKLEVWN